MTHYVPTQLQRRRAGKVVVTAIAVLIAMFALNTLQSDRGTSTLATQGVLALPSNSQPAAPASPAEVPVVATTPPLAIPSTPVPTSAPILPPTSVPAPTPVPAATAVPPTPVPQPEPATEPATTEAAEPAFAAAPAVTPTVERERAAPDAPNPQLPDPTPSAPPALLNEPAEPAEPTEPDELAEPAEPVTVALTATAVVPTATATPAVVFPTTDNVEQYVLGRLNVVRAEVGLAPLTLDPAISSISQDWSRQMATQSFFSHRPSDQISSMLPSGWRAWGENIASAPDIVYAQSSLEASPGHYQNMVGDYNVVGIGVFERGGQIWLTQNFARY